MEGAGTEVATDGGATVVAKREAEEVRAAVEDMS